MSDQPKRCKWCGCEFTLTVFSFGEYCSPACYKQAQQAKQQAKKDTKTEEENG